jgi:hypothetical protein
MEQIAHAARRTSFPCFAKYKPNNYFCGEMRFTAARYL